MSLKNSAGATVAFPNPTPPTVSWRDTSTTSNSSIVATTLEPLADTFLPYDLYTQYYTPLFVTIAMRTLPLVWIAIGIPSNLLCARVWLSRELRHSSSIYLAAIALADFALLLMYPLFFLQIRIKTWVPSYHGLCNFYVWYFYSVQYIPPLLLVAFSAERWYVVSFPFHSHRFCNVRTAVIITLSISLFCIGINIPQTLFIGYSQKYGCVPYEYISGNPDPTLEILKYIMKIVTDNILFSVASIALVFFNVWVIVVVRRSSRTEAVTLSNRVQMNTCRVPNSNGARSAVGKESPDRESGALLNNNHENNGSSPNAESSPPQRKLSREPERISTHTLSPQNAHDNQRGHSTSTAAAGSPRQRQCSASTTQQVSVVKARKNSGNGAATTVALLCISFYYIVTTVPLSIFEILVQLVKAGPGDIPLSQVPQNAQWHAFFAMHTVRLLVVDFAMSHYVIFFYIYLFTSPAFRNATIKVLAAYIPCVFGRIHKRIVRAERQAMLETFV